MSITESSTSVINQLKLHRISICGFIHGIRGTMRQRNQLTAVQCTKTGNEHLTGCNTATSIFIFITFFINTSFVGFSAFVIKASTCRRAVMTKPSIISNLIHSGATESHLQFVSLQHSQIQSFQPNSAMNQMIGPLGTENGIGLRFKSSKHEFF